jgi:hypothetical protein
VQNWWAILFDSGNPGNYWPVWIVLCGGFVNGVPAGLWNSDKSESMIYEVPSVEIPPAIG